MTVNAVTNCLRLSHTHHYRLNIELVLILEQWSLAVKINRVKVGAVVSRMIGGLVCRYALIQSKCHLSDKRQCSFYTEKSTTYSLPGLIHYFWQGEERNTPTCFLNFKLAQINGDCSALNKMKSSKKVKRTTKKLSVNFANSSLHIPQ